MTLTLWLLICYATSLLGLFASLIKEKDGEWKVRIESPLFDPKQRELMDDDERVVCAFYVSTIGLCRALLNAEEFSPMTLGIDGDEEFLVDNEPLIDFVLE
jgi:hypothetical protein